MWGYDISVFNFHDENEILLEPETQFKVEESIPELNGIIDITCEIKKTPLILDFISNNEIELESKESIIPIEIEYELDESNILRDFKSNRFGINRFNDEDIFRFNDNNRHRFDFQFEKNKMKISRSPNEKISFDIDNRLRFKEAENIKGKLKNQNKDMVKNMQMFIL